MYPHREKTAHTEKGSVYMVGDEGKVRTRGRGFFTSPVVVALVKVVAVGIFTVSLLMSLTFIVLLIVGAAAVSGAGAERGYTGYRKTYLDSRPSAFKDGSASEIAVLYVEGIISEYDQRDSLLGYIENSVSAVKNRLDLVRSDPAIRGVLLVIDSPGGGVTASDVLYTHLVRFKEETGIPIVALMKEVAASGGYYVAAACDEIVAYPTAITGSIGVILYSFNFSGLMEKYGVEYVAVKTSEHKDSLSPFKPVDEAEIEWMQAVVDQMLEHFLDAVDQGRENLSRGEIEGLADGRIYLASDALDLGLIDRIGYFDDAVSVLAERAGVSEPSLVEYEREVHFRDIIGRVHLNLPSSFLDQRILEEGRPQFYYLWNAVTTRH
jgi:protease-4